MGSFQLNNAQLVGKVDLAVNVEKSTYFKGEWVRVEIEVRNLFNDSIKIPNPDDKVKLIKVDPNGKTIPKPYSDDRIGGSMSMIVLPAGRTWLLTASFDPSWRGGNIPLGSYKVYAVYEDLVSDTVSFDYVELPSNEREVKSKLSKIRRLPMNTREVKLRHLISEYPNSVFLPDIYMKLLIRITSDSRKYDENLVIRTVLECIEKMPNAFFTRTVLDFYDEALKIKYGLKGKKSLSQKEKKLLEEDLLKLKAKYENKRVAKYIDDFLMRKEYNAVGD